MSFSALSVKTKSMRTLFTTFLSLILFNVNAQLYPLSHNYPINDYNKTYLDENEGWISKLGQAHQKIKSIRVTNTKFPNEPTTTTLNEKGLVTERLFTNRWRIGPFKFKHHYHKKFEYEKEQLIKVNQFNKNKDITYTYTYSYFAPHLLSKYTISKNGKALIEDINEYNTDSTRLEYRSYVYKKDKPQLKTRYTYAYYPDKQRKQTCLFNKKNKLMHTWNYDCNPKGELEKKNTQVCKNTNYDARGRIIDITFYTDAKGKKSKQVYIYWLKDGKRISSVQEQYIVVKGKERKLYEIHYADSLEPWYSYKSYNTKERLSIERKEDYRIYTSTHKIPSTFKSVYYSHGKAGYSSTTEYNESGLPLKSESFNRKQRSLGKVVYSYSGDSTYTITHFDKKEKISEVHKGTVSYY